MQSWRVVVCYEEYCSLIADNVLITEAFWHRMLWSGARLFDELWIGKWALFSKERHTQRLLSKVNGATQNDHMIFPWIYLHAMRQVSICKLVTSHLKAKLLDRREVTLISSVYVAVESFSVIQTWNPEKRRAVLWVVFSVERPLVYGHFKSGGF